MKLVPYWPQCNEHGYKYPLLEVSVVWVLPVGFAQLLLWALSGAALCPCHKIIFFVQLPCIFPHPFPLVNSPMDRLRCFDSVLQ